MNHDGVMILLIGVVAVSLIALRRASMTVDEPTLARWAAVHSLELTADNWAMVTWYLRTARVLRAWGAVAGALLPPLIGLAFGAPLQVLGFGTDGSGAPGAVVFILLGYLVGAFYAEVSLVRRGGSVRRSARLVPRDLGDYLPARLLWLQRGLGATAVIGAVLAGLVTLLDWGSRSQEFSHPGPGGVLLYAGLVVAFTVGLECLLRWLVQRPQPFVDPDLVAADDAIRSQSVHSLAASGIAVLLLQCGLMLIVLGAYGGPMLSWTLGIAGFGVCLSSVVAFQHFGHRAWRVGHQAAGPPGPA